MFHFIIWLPNIPTIVVHHNHGLFSLFYYKILKIYLRPLCSHSPKTTRHKSSMAEAEHLKYKKLTSASQKDKQNIIVNLSCTNLILFTCARCKNDVCLFREETNLRAIGSFLSIRISGRFSKEETTHCSQFFAKFLISASKLQ